MAALAYGVWLLAGNTARNLAARHIATGFGFLSANAPIPIGETPIHYEASVSSYARALLVGHHPGISRLARWLTDDDELDEFTPATLLGTGAELDRWEDAERGLFQRLLLLRPADAHR